MALPLRHPRVWLAIGWTLVALAMIGSLMPGNSAGNLGLFWIGDKVLHAGTYTVLTLWFAGLYPRSRYAVIAIGLLLLGVGAEFAQGAMHFGRDADLQDVVANSIGIIAGLALALAGLGGWARQIEKWLDRS